MFGWTRIQTNNFPRSQKLPQGAVTLSQRHQAEGRQQFRVR